MSQLRIGILGAARIAPTALIDPSRNLPQVEVAAIAARDPQRARQFASRHGIARVHDSYQALLSDPQLDAVYIALPNGLHGRWTVAALEAGKHVLCEKPFAANADEAQAVAAVARRTGRVTMEAFHYRYHALMRRLLAILASGELGSVTRIETAFCVPLLLLGDIRWNLKLAGGSVMDVGCYAIHLLRTLAGAEPSVSHASARLLKPGIDRLLIAEMRFADGRSGSIMASMLSRHLLKASARVIGTQATLEVSNPIAPQYYHRIRVRTAGGTRQETVAAQPSTYAAQLHAFVAAIRDGRPYPTGVDDAIANMRVIDACYTAAGLPRREPSSVEA